MSNLLTVREVKATGVVPEAVPSPEFGTETIHSEIPTKASNYQQPAVNFDSLLSGHQGDSFLHAPSLISLEKPKAGLTKTKKNLKKQLFLKKAAAQDDGRQTPNLPSPSHCTENGNTGTNRSLNAITSSTSTGSAIDSFKMVESESAEAKKGTTDNEKLITSVTVKIEAADNDDITSSSTSVCSTVTAMQSECSANRKTASEDLCPSPCETISQSGTETARPTKWIIGDMLWARVSGHPFWPCMVAYDPTHTAFTRTLKRRQGTLVQYHVQFFGDEGERGWINEGAIIPYEGVEAFNKFCDEMKVVHKKERQNYTVPPRRVKAWNVAVRSAEEAYPMTRVFRVHRFAFVYDQPVMINGCMVANENDFSGGSQQGSKSVKRSRSSSVGGSGDGQSKKRRRMSGEKSMTSPTDKVSKICWFPLNNRMIGQTNQENSSSCEGTSPDTGSPVFRSRPEGVKRSSRFVKPTHRIMEHLEEVEQRRRIKLRPHHKVSKSESDAVADHLAEELHAFPKDSESILATAEEVDVTETAANSQSSQLNNSSVPDQFAIEKPSLSLFFQMKLEGEVSVNCQQIISTNVGSNQKKVSEETEVNCQEVSMPQELHQSEKEHSNRESAANMEAKESNQLDCEMILALHRVNAPVGMDVHSDSVKQADPIEITNSELKKQKRKYRRTKDLPSHELQNVTKKKIRVSKLKNLKKTTEADTSTVSSPLELVSVTSVSCTNIKQQKLMNKQKSIDIPNSQVSNLSVCLTSDIQPEVSGILVCSPSKSVAMTASHCLPEFQRLSFTGPQRSEEVCHICEQSGDILIDCQGPCFGSYHLSCLGLTVSPVGSFRCDECSTGNHPCFVCKLTSRDTVACSASKCGRFYHRECINKFPLTKMDSNSIICPLHICATCAAETGRNGRASKGPMYRCIRCPTAYHASDNCIAAGTVEIAGYNIVCNSHLLSPKSSKCGLVHINASWCFVCSKDSGSLTLCSSCPAAFHASCAKINPNTDMWKCKDCVIGKRPLYGEVVWAKVGNYRWWPGEVCRMRNSLVESANKAGYFAVHLFGMGLQFWLQQGRVFPFRNNDRLSHESVYRTMSEQFERAVSEAAEVYLMRLDAKDGKTYSDREKNEQKPAHYKHIKANIPLGNVEIYKASPSEILSCHCTADMENPCGPDSDCINRLMMYECNVLVCPAGERCLNQRFQRHEDSDVRPYKTGQRGWGLRNRSDIKKGQFIAEYVGDLVDPEECNQRLAYAQQHGITNFYMLTLDKNRIIDAGPKGNYSRFMNHSCEPNCETQKWTVNGDIRVGLFALHDIPTGSELTFNYNLDCYGNQKTVCKCGSTICSGFLGVRPKTTAAANVEKKVREAKLKRKLKEIKSRDRPDICFACKKRGGEMVICENSDCCKSYHQRCLKPFRHNKGKFSCPLHECDSCYLKASKPCSICPRSFCLLHLNGNIYEISDGSLVCSRHQDILNSCFQDGWITSNQDGNNVVPNIISCTQLSVEKPLTITENRLPDEVDPVQKQSKIRSKTSTKAQVVRKRRRVTEAGPCATGAAAAASSAEPKKCGRPLKMAINGSVDKEAKDTSSEQTSIGNNHLITKKAKAVVNRRPKEKSRSGKRNWKANSIEDDGLQLQQQTLKEASVAEGLQCSESSGSNLHGINDSKTGTAEMLSQANHQSHSSIDFDKSLGLISGGSTQEQFSPLILEESY